MRTCRKELALTMQAVADAAGLSVGFVSHVEPGLTAPSLVSIAAVLMKPLSHFLEQPVSAQELACQPVTSPGSVAPLSAAFIPTLAYTIIEPPIGDWGASHGRDGDGCIFSSFHGKTYSKPAEISEARNGLFVDRMEPNTTPGGEGQFTGWRGLVLEYRIRTDNDFLTAGYTRSTIKPRPLQGGAEGSSDCVEVIRTDGSQ